MRVDALEERIDMTEREVDNELYHIWMKKLPVSEFGDMKLAIAKKRQRTKTRTTRSSTLQQTRLTHQQNT